MAYRKWNGYHYIQNKKGYTLTNLEILKDIVKHIRDNILLPELINGENIYREEIVQYLNGAKSSKMIYDYMIKEISNDGVELEIKIDQCLKSYTLEIELKD